LPVACCRVWRRPDGLDARVVFFQVVLFAGYAYGHRGDRFERWGAGAPGAGRGRPVRALSTVTLIVGSAGSAVDAFWVLAGWSACRRS
jgi:hypothetical protein